MATLNDEGNIRARCPGCGGAWSTFEWRTASGTFGAVQGYFHHDGWGQVRIDHRLFRCAGCGRGGLGAVVYGSSAYPGAYRELRGFYPETRERLPLPQAVPAGLVREFREAEDCLAAGCIRAAAGMVRSVLDKTLRANGYKTDRESLKQQIDAAAKDGVITEARKRRAHEDIRVLGNDVLHDEWLEIKAEAVEVARQYAQRILEDFYDDRESVLKQLRDAKRVPDEDRPAPSGGA
jgi:uncharacterized protein DUF4145